MVSGFPGPVERCHRHRAQRGEPRGGNQQGAVLLDLGFQRAAVPRCPGPKLDSFEPSPRECSGSRHDLRRERGTIRRRALSSETFGPSSAGARVPPVFRAVLSIWASRCGSGTSSSMFSVSNSSRVYPNIPHAAESFCADRSRPSSSALENGFREPLPARAAIQ